MADPKRALIPFTGGHNSKKDPGMVGVNQLIKTQGVEYLVGDTEIIYKIPGRSLFGSVGAVGKVQGLSLATYDDGTVFLLAVAAQKVWYADASNGFTGTFTAGSIGSGNRQAGTAFMSSAHYQNRWYVATGLDSNVVVESDGTMVDHGMVQPQAGDARTTWTVSAYPTNHYVLNPTAVTGNWHSVNHSANEGGELQQAVPVIIAACSLDDIQTSVDIELETTFTNTFAGRYVEMFHYLGDAHGEITPGSSSDKPEIERDWKVRLQVKIATDGGTTFTTVMDARHRSNFGGIRSIQIPIADDVAANLVTLRVELDVEEINLGVNAIRYRVYNAAQTNGEVGVTSYSNTAGSMFYAYSEYDSERQWESALSEVIEVPFGTAFTGIEFELPTTARNGSATHLNLYRTSNQNTTYIRSEMGLVGSVEIGQTTFTDNFRRWLPSEIPTDPSYEWLILDEFGITTYHDLHLPPPPMEWIGNFKGALFGLSNRAYYQAVAGSPTYWPDLFKIERMPFKEHSPLKVGFQVGDVLWIGAESGIVLLDHPIETRAGNLRIPAPRKMEGAPGCVGAYAATTLEHNGEPMVAWVSNHGVYISNLATYARLTTDIDWETLVAEGALDKAVLEWREKKQQLVLHYPANGQTENNRFMLIHMGEDQQTEKNRPAITTDHPGNFSCRTAGRIGGVYKEFTGNKAAAGVYLEGGSSTQDVSNSYNGSGDIPVTLKTGRQYFEGGIDVGRSQIFHTAPTGGTTISLTISYITGRDESEVDTTLSALYAMTGTRSRWFDFGVNQGGDWMQWEFSTVGQVKFGLGPIAPMVDTDDAQGIIE